MYIFFNRRDFLSEEDRQCSSETGVSRALRAYTLEQGGKEEAQRVADELERSRDLSSEFTVLSELTEDTLSDLREDGRSTVNSYSHLYPQNPSPRVKLDVAKAMALSSGKDRRRFGWIDGVAAKIMEIKFWKFADMKDFHFAPARGGRIAFRDLRRTDLRPFLNSTEDSSLLLDFDFYSGQGKVSLRLKIGTLGHAIWDLRGLSSLKPTHQKLRDELQEIVRDYEQRKKWLEEYLALEPQPGLVDRQVELVEGALSYYFPNRTLDLSLLKTSLRFEGDSIALDEHTAAYIGRCGDCGHISFLDILERQGDGPRAWVSHREDIERSAFRVLSEIHGSQVPCGRTHYVSGLTGELEALPSSVRREI